MSAVVTSFVVPSAAVLTRNNRQPETCEQKLDHTTAQLENLRDDLRDHGLYSQGDMLICSGLSILATFVFVLMVTMWWSDEN